MELFTALTVLLDIPDDPTIHAVKNGTPIGMILGVVIAAAVLLYVFFLRKRTES